MKLSDDLIKALNAFEKTNHLFKQDSTLIQDLSACYIDNLMIIFFYTDKVDKKYYIKNIMNPSFNSGLGEHLKYGDNSYIVIYGESKGFYSKKDFFLKAFIHEYMHYLNRNVIFNKEIVDLPIGYPDLRDKKFSKYFARMSERRSYIACLQYSFYNYINFLNISLNDLKNKVYMSCNNLNLFNKLIEEFYFYNLDVSSLYLLFHLSFSENNKHELNKVLQEIFI